MKDRVWSPEAEEEFTAAAEWYEERAEGLGFRFAQEVRRFPYVIVYEEREDRLNLLAIAHTSRRPGYWTARKT